MKVLDLTEVCKRFQLKLDLQHNKGPVRGPCCLKNEAELHRALQELPIGLLDDTERPCTARTRMLDCHFDVGRGRITGDDQHLVGLD